MDASVRWCGWLNNRPKSNISLSCRSLTGPVDLSRKIILRNTLIWIGAFSSWQLVLFLLYKASSAKYAMCGLYQSIFFYTASINLISYYYNIVVPTCNVPLLRTLRQKHICAQTTKILNMMCLKTKSDFRYWVTYLLTLVFPYILTTTAMLIVTNIFFC